MLLTFSTIRAFCRVGAFALFWLPLPNIVQAQQGPSVSLTLYSQGDPTDGEQYLMQQLNRARQDPAGEGQRLAAWLRDTSDGQAVISHYGVDPDQIASAFAALPAAPPLAFDPDLLAAARSHSTDMAVNNFEGHTGSDGSTPESRVDASGFQGVFASENVAYPFESLDEIHAAYLVDWGNPDLGHRLACMNGTGAWNVVGVGLATASDGMFAETEDYGAFELKPNPNGLPMLAGVVYNDDNSNGQYDPGEGVAGVTITVQGGAYYAVTSASGGYAFPLVNADGSDMSGQVQVSLTFPDGDTFTDTVTVNEYPGGYGPYLASVELDSVNQSGGNARLPSISGGGTLAAGGKLKLVVARPATTESDLTQPLTVAYKLTGTAVAGVDYAPLPGTVTIPAGKATAKIRVTALDNPLAGQPSGAATLVLKLRGVAGTQGKATVTFAP